jgi:hypothetical protein
MCENKTRIYRSRQTSRRGKTRQHAVGQKGHCLWLKMAGRRGLWQKSQVFSEIRQSMYPFHIHLFYFF